VEEPPSDNQGRHAERQPAEAERDDQRTGSIFEPSSAAASCPKAMAAQAAKSALLTFSPMAPKIPQGRAISGA